MKQIEGIFVICLRVNDEHTSTQDISKSYCKHIKQA